MTVVRQLFFFVALLYACCLDFIPDKNESVVIAFEPMPLALFSTEHVLVNPIFVVGDTRTNVSLFYMCVVWVEVQLSTKILNNNMAGFHCSVNQSRGHVVDKFAISDESEAVSAILAITWRMIIRPKLNERMLRTVVCVFRHNSPKL